LKRNKESLLKNKNHGNKSMKWINLIYKSKFPLKIYRKISAAYKIPKIFLSNDRILFIILINLINNNNHISDMSEISDAKDIHSSK